MTSLPIYNPARGSVLRQLTTHSASDVQEMTQMARRAQKEWCQRTIGQRADVLRTFNRLLMDRTDQLALTLSTETGKPINQARNEIRATPDRISYFIDHMQAELAPAVMHVESAGAPVPGIGTLDEVVTYEPLGVVGNISAWNYPYFVGSNVFAPALLAGNAVIYKPSEYAALTGLAITGLLHEAGVPEAVFSVAVGKGDIGQALIDSGIDGVFFTGSYETGLRVASAAAGHLMRVQLELGGKDPAYVAEDADPRVAAQALADGAFYNNGQSCCAVERIYVHHSVLYAFRSAFVEAVSGFRMGDPEDPETYLGPLTRREQLAVIQNQVDDAVAKGATLLLGGQAADREGWYYKPTILSDVNHEMSVMREESFGPIIGIQSVQSDQEAAELMADTPYGLTASVYSRDRARAANILQTLPTGSSYWNCCDRVSPRLPWTGRGHSGLGSTLSREGIRAFVQPRSWHFRAPS